MVGVGSRPRTRNMGRTRLIRVCVCTIKKEQIKKNPPPDDGLEMTRMERLLRPLTLLLKIDKKEWNDRPSETGYVIESFLANANVGARAGYHAL